jgi:hypothetical protein
MVFSIVSVLGLYKVQLTVSCRWESAGRVLDLSEMVASLQGRQPGRRGTSTVTEQRDWAQLSPVEDWVSSQTVDSWVESAVKQRQH